MDHATVVFNHTCSPQSPVPAATSNTFILPLSLSGIPSAAEAAVTIGALNNSGGNS